MSQRELAMSRQAALEMYESFLAHPAGVVLCQTCRCPWLAHYGAAGPGRGCVACESRYRRCQVYIQGPVPYNLSKHADRLDAPGPCPWLCGHAAGDHSGSYGCMECACRYGEPGAAAPAGITYRGYPDTDPRGHRLVVVEAPPGSPVTRLTEFARHRPSGFDWGCGGTGPSALARSLLISVLGPAAACPACQGNKMMAWAADLSAMVPYDAEYDEPPGELFDCECEDGYRSDLPCRSFESAVIDGLGQDLEWVISRAEILHWLASVAPDLRAAADRILPEGA